jgi:glycosyltransferase involved in cell wall biosynthesis
MCERLFEAFSFLHRPAQRGLLLVGGGDILEAGLADLAEGRPVIMAHMDDADLRSAYAAAAALVLPVECDDLPLSAVEAMACGCPVIACANSSAVATACDGVAVVDCGDAHRLAEAMVRVLDPAERAALREGGLIAANGIRWADTARSVQDLIALVRGDGERSAGAVHMGGLS